MRKKLKLLTLALVFCLLVGSVPAASAYIGEWKVAPENTHAREEHDPTAGLAWLAEDEKVKKEVQVANNRYVEDESIYDVAKKSILFFVGSRKAYMNGFATYVDFDDESIAPFVESERIYLPVRFLADALGLRVLYEETESTVVMTGEKTVKLSLGSRILTVDDETLEMDAPVLSRNDRTFIPARAVAEAFEKSVIYDERGFVIVTDEETKAQITEEHLNQMAREDFTLDRTKILHPYNKDKLIWTLNSSERTNVRTSGEAAEEIMTPYLAMSYAELAALVDETMNGAPWYLRPDFEKAAALMANKYEETKDEDLALRIIIMLYHEALNYDSLEKDGGNWFNNYAYVTPVLLLWGYDRIYHSPMWDVFDAGYGTDAKKVLGEWWTSLYNYHHANSHGEKIGNYPVDLGHRMMLAILMDDPDWVRDMYEELNEAIKPYSFYSDGLWYELSFDYSNQMVGNCSAMARVLASYFDPLCYVDTRHGLHFRGNFDYMTEWGDWFDYISKISKTNVYYPNGDKFLFNDTNWVTPVIADADKPIQAELMEENMVLNHAGLFGMRYGDTEEAQQLNIEVQSATGVSHTHINPLGISYYSAGMELLPDIGYIRSSNGHRYSFNNQFGHNTAWAGTYATGNDSYWEYPNVLSYEDGASTDKQLQFVEASNLMPKSYGFNTNRRLVMMIATDKNHSYAVDLHRISSESGIHEAYLQQVQEEDVEFKTSLSLNQYDGLTRDWLAEKSGTGSSLSDYMGYNGIFKNPQWAKTDESFWYTYTGKTTGTTLKAFIKGNEDALIGFSEMPTARRAMNDASKRDDFPGYHFVRRQKVKAGELTTFGGVYEGYRRDEEGKVLNVTWYEPDDGDDETALVCVELADSYDYIYSSNDCTERSFTDLGLTFAGQVAYLRVSKTDNSVLRSYLYGEGKVQLGDYLLTGKENLSWQVVEADGARPIYDTENYLKINGAATDELCGLWGNVTFSDDSGKIYRIESVDQSVIHIEGDPGFKVTERGAEFTAYPLYEDHATGKLASFAQPYDKGTDVRYREGDIILTVKRPTYFSK